MEVDSSHTEETGWKHNKGSPQLVPTGQEKEGASSSDTAKTTRHRCDIGGC